jgi:hypothetical protein
MTRLNHEAHEEHEGREIAPKNTKGEKKFILKNLRALRGEKAVSLFLVVAKDRRRAGDETFGVDFAFEDFALSQREEIAEVGT